VNPTSTTRTAALCGAALLLAAPFAGIAGAMLLTPLGAGALALALWLRRGAGLRAAPWLVVAGGFGALVGLGVAMIGSLLAGFWVVAAGGTLAFAGTQLALAEPDDEVDVPAPLSARTNLAAAADAGMQWWWQATALVSPPPRSEEVVAAIGAAAERNRAAGILEDPRRAHPVPPALEKATLAPLHLAGLPAAEALTFESEFEPRDPEIRDAYLEAASNRVGSAVLFRHQGPARPTLLVVHGYGMGRPGLDARQLDVPWLHEGLGLDVAMVLLPMHGRRAPGRRSGAGFLDGHPLATNAAFEQAVFEMRRMAGWLRSQGAPAIGVTGMSLGGYTTALFASVERGLACAVPTIPVASLSRLLRSTWSEEQRAAADAVGFTPALLDAAWASHDPLRHRPQVAPEGRLIIAGQVDRICPPHQARALWSHWEEPSIHWFPGSHLARFPRADIRERQAAHLRATLLRAPETAPRLTRFRQPEVAQPG
jgi:dienelactone hydrolase